jgi:3-hydroxyacyl-CoA dehydrogenase/enoyl-CoA hydratase/3-hydroxybutyryl-CoA epimerase
MEAASFRLEEQTAKYGGTKLWTLTLDVPGEKVNKIGPKLLQDFEATMTELETLGSQGKIDALVLVSGKPGNFIAGADIEMLAGVKTTEQAITMCMSGHALCNRWEDLPYPTVAAVDGAALGGGCELALACTAIVMSDASFAKIGLPEVQLGILPGMGGTLRMPRKVGLATALDLILNGKSLSGDRAVKAGLAEAVLPEEAFQDSAHRWAKTNLARLKSGERIAKEPKLGGMGGTMGSVMEHTPMGRAVIFKKAREGVMSKTRGHYPAPLEIIDVLQHNGYSVGPKLKGAAREQAQAREAQGFGKLVVTDVSKNLIRLFFLTEGVKKSKGLPPGVTANPRDVKSGGVLGAGVMGGGIAQLLADRGVSARMKDIATPALATGIAAAAKIFQGSVKRRKITKREYMQKLNLIAPLLDYSGFKSVDAVIEAVVENMDVKKKVLAELEKQVHDECVIASNTSSLSITEIQKAFARPQRFVGMHFFNPVHKMPLVEVIRGEQSSDDAVATIFQFSKKLGKQPIVVKDSPGFLVNRILGPYLMEAIYLLGDGAPIQELDKALLDFGMPMGPAELIDEVGIDVAEKVAHIFEQAFGNRMKPSDLNAKVTAAGRLGKKNGKGFYNYEEGGRKKVFDEKINEILGITPKSGAVSSEEMVERCILPMINEAARCLDEGVVASASEVDLGMIMGTGFPPFRGGLLRYADSLGAQTVVDRLKKYEPRLGKRFEPSAALLARAKNGQLFYPA